MLWLMIFHASVYQMPLTGTSILTHLHNWQKPTQQIHCKGRGSYQRTRLDRFGFPRGFLIRQKQVCGFQTGDRVIAKVSKGKKIGNYTGRAIPKPGY